MCNRICSSSKYDGKKEKGMTFKTAITGGRRGIGAAISKLLAARGANVIVNYLSNKDAADNRPESYSSRPQANEVRRNYSSLAGIVLENSTKKSGQEQGLMINGE